MTAWRNRSLAPGAANMARQFDQAITKGYGSAYFPVVRRLLKKT